MSYFGIDSHGFAESLEIQYVEGAPILRFFSVLGGDSLIIVTKKGEIIRVKMKSTKDYQTLIDLKLGL